MTGPPRKILVVDDEKLIQRMTRFILERSHYEVHVASDGKEALRLVREVRPDLILLDVQLPHMDGFDVLAVLRQSPDMRDIPVVMLSSLAEATDRTRGLGLGASEYLTKPYEATDLLACVSRHIR
jgi:two-component system response regulator VicR